jgi:hypothetical protein
VPSDTPAAAATSLTDGVRPLSGWRVDMPGELLALKR